MSTPTDQIATKPFDPWSGTRHAKTTRSFSVPLVVAVTGHRDLLPAELPRIRERVRAFLCQLRDAYPDRSIAVMCALAEGADRVVAEAGDVLCGIGQTVPELVFGHAARDALTAVWRNTPPANGFKQTDPQDGSPATEQTDVWVAYDDHALYVAAFCRDSDPSKIRKRLGRRDTQTDSDWFGVFIDPYFDRRSGYLFAANPAGSITDSALSNDVNEDESWDGIWETTDSTYDCNDVLQSVDTFTDTLCAGQLISFAEDPSGSGMNITCTNSATATGLGIISTDPPRLSEPTTISRRALKRKFTPKRCHFISIPLMAGAMYNPAASHAVAIQKIPSWICHVRVTT